MQGDTAPVTQGPNPTAGAPQQRAQPVGRAQMYKEPVGRLKFFHIAADSSLGTRSGWLSDGEHTVEYLIGTKLLHIDSVG